MTDILERLHLMHYRLAAESEDQAANRRVQTAKDAAEEIKKLRAEVEGLRAAELQRQRSASLDGYRPDEDGFGGHPMMFNYYGKR
jgi:hypothetical protein